MAAGETAEMLDNAVWHALRSRQSSFAVSDPSGRALRFDREVALFGAVEDLNEAGWAAQAELAGPGGFSVLFRRSVPPPAPGWTETLRLPGWQMVAGDLVAAPELESVELGPEDAAEMLTLAQLTEPGPFHLRTGELGGYRGVRRDGRLVAMAGERLKVPGWTEVSAVCTHPDARREGLGAALTLQVAEAIRASGEEAFLHVVKGNDNALRLYRALGFEVRASVDAVVLQWGQPASTQPPEPHRR